MLDQLARGLHSLLFPASCLDCRLPLEETGGPPLCASCRRSLPRCLSPWSAEPGKSLDGIVSPFLYEGACRETVLALKYGGRTSVAAFLGACMAEEVLQRHGEGAASVSRVAPAPRHFLGSGEGAASVSRVAPAPRHFLGSGEGAASVILPVPLHPVRLRERGFNQSELLARELSKRLGIPCDAGRLVRCRPTAPQAQLTRHERAANVRGAFDLRAGPELSGLRILLVDDVFTTGATAEACAALLKAAGACSVTAATAARD